MCVLFSADEEPPEYDVTERLRQLNAELEQEPMPEDDSRERSIKFQEDPVSLIVPPDNYSDTEDDQNPQDMADNQDSQSKLDSSQQRQDLGGSGDSGGQQQDSDDRLSPRAGADGSGDAPSSKESDQYSEDWQDTEPESVGNGRRHYSDSHDYEEAATSDGEEEEAAPEGNKDTEQTANKSESENEDAQQQQSHQQEQRSNENNDDNMIVIERNGKFEHVNVNELTAEERELYGVQTEEDKKEEKQVHEPKPPSHPRPSTASHPQQRRAGRGAPRSTSAMGHSSTDSGNSNCNYKSPYAMTDEEKKRRLKEQNEQERQKKEEEKAQKEQEERDRADAEDAFQAWLCNKRKEAQEKRKQEKENQKKEQGEKKGKEVYMIKFYTRNICSCYH